jgi:co-chaperonin GroES (HSP10)
MILTKVPKPKKGWVYVRALKEQEGKTAGGIIMPHQAKEMQMYSRALVTAVGDNTREYDMECKVGDEVIMNAKFLDLSNRMISVNGDPAFLLREETDVIGWVHEQDRLVRPNPTPIAPKEKKIVL